MTMGTLSSPDGKTHATGITVLGIDQRFFDFSRDSLPLPDLITAGYWASPDLAAELETEVGDRLVLRVEEPSLFSRDAPLSGEKMPGLFPGIVLIWANSVMGQWAIFLCGQAWNQSVLFFVPLSMIQEDMFVLIFGRWGKDRLYESSLSWSREKPIDPMMDAMERCWTLADAGLQIKNFIPEMHGIFEAGVFFCRTGLFIQPDK